MMSFNRNLKLIWESYRPVIITKVKDDFLSSGLRLYSADVPAVQRLSFRHRNRYKKRLDFGSSFVLIIPIGATALGTWQVFRKLEKDKFIEEFMEKIKQPPIELPKNLEELPNMEFHSVKVKGKFDHSRELFLGPRPQVRNDIISKLSTLLSREKGGYLVVTPFKLSDRDVTILVNRGWVPAKMKSPLKRREGQITEEVELVGFIRNHQKRPPLGVKNMPEVGFWAYRDLYKMAEMAGTAPIFLDANEDSTVPGGPLGGQTVLEVKNIHMSYIYTWYGLAILSGWLWYKNYLQRKPLSLPYISKPPVAPHE